MSVDPGYFAQNPFSQNPAMNPFMAMMPPGGGPAQDPRMNQWAAFYQQNFGDGGQADPGDQAAQKSRQQPGAGDPGNTYQNKQQQPRY